MLFSNCLACHVMSCPSCILPSRLLPCLKFYMVNLICPPHVCGNTRATWLSWLIRQICLLCCSFTTGLKTFICTHFLLLTIITASCRLRAVTTVYHICVEHASLSHAEISADVHLQKYTSVECVYSLSNVIMADEKFLSFHQYLRYSHDCGTIAFSTPSAII